jgi:hypothetical protein
VSKEDLETSSRGALLCFSSRVGREFGHWPGRTTRDSISCDCAKAGRLLSSGRPAEKFVARGCSQFQDSEN